MFKGLGQLGDMAKMMKQAQEMQSASGKVHFFPRHSVMLLSTRKITYLIINNGVGFV